MLVAGSGPVRSATSRSSYTSRAGDLSAAIIAGTCASSPRCPDCGSNTLARHGAGTERLEHELREALGGPGFPVFRLDADTAGGGAAVLSAFDGAPPAAPVHGTVGRQGDDFPEVVLGVVLDEDQTLLRFPDSRAEERTFALVTQLRGGRGGGTGGDGCW